MVLPDGIVSVLAIIGCCTCLFTSAQTVQYCNKSVKFTPTIYPAEKTAPTPHMLRRQ